MAETEIITTEDLQKQKIPPSFITKNGVQSLADRPNQMSPFSGRGGMSPAELKAAFDKLSVKLVEMVNKIIDYSTSGNVYVPWGERATNLTELVAALENCMLNVIQVPTGISTTNSDVDLYSEFENHKRLFSQADRNIVEVNDKVCEIWSVPPESQGLALKRYPSTAYTKAYYNITGRGECTDKNIVFLDQGIAIEESAFEGDELLESVTIGRDIYIRSRAFAACKKLKWVRFLCSYPPYSISEDAFDDTIEKIIVPPRSLERYKTKPSLSKWVDKIVPADTVGELRDEIDNLWAELNELITEGLPSADDTSYVDAKATELMAYVNNKATEQMVYTDTKLAELINSAPEALNTLNELSAALGGDPNFAATVLSMIGQKAAKEGIKDAYSINGEVRYPSEGLIYEFNEDGESYKVVGLGTCTDINVVVPRKYNGLPITAIGDNAFEGANIDSINLWECVTSIGNETFKGCAPFRFVYIHSTTPIAVGTDTFPDTVKGYFVPLHNVEDYKADEGWTAYADKIVAIETAESINTSIVNVYNAAMANDNNLAQLIQNLANNQTAFINRDNDLQIQINNAARYSQDLEYVVVNVNGALGFGVNGIGACTDKEIVIPPTYNGFPVLKIMDNAFCVSSGSLNLSVTVPESVVEIGIYGLQVQKATFLSKTVPSFTFDNSFYDFAGAPTSPAYGTTIAVRTELVDEWKATLKGKSYSEAFRDRVKPIETLNTLRADVDANNLALQAQIDATNEKLNLVQAPAFVDSVDEMTDTSKVYVLTSTGTIWANKVATVLKTVTHEITDGFESGRVGSSGSISALAGYVTTPYIDLVNDKDGNPYTSPFTLHLKGISFSYESVEDGYIVHGQYQADKTFVKRWNTQATAFADGWKNAAFTDNGDGTCQIVFTPPLTDKAGTTPIGYARFTGLGSEANANVYITYEKEVMGQVWADTGIVYGGNGGETVADMTSFALVNPSVKAFMETADYDDSDYSDTNVNNYVGDDYYRKDLPFPIILVWERKANAVQYAITIGSQTYYTKDNTLSVYNLVPNTTYSYKVCALCADGSKALIKSSSFNTTDSLTRMLNIDGIQNVRDIGGYPAYAGTSSMVKYGLIFRGSAMDEAIQDTLRITDKGKQEMVSRVGIKTDLDLRGANNVTESALGNGIDFYTPPYSYESYVNAITNATQKGYFKAMLEYIVEQLSANKPVYIHCSGGCDRTGTLVFLLLGLLGVSESDLAKEYELSSFSAIGGGTRIRNSTVYDYSGMVAAIKAYSGDTITDKFVNFAADCGITNDTITSFRTLMLY